MSSPGWTHSPTRNIILAVTGVILYLSGQAQSQKHDDELLRLRLFLPASDTKAITTAKSPALPSVRPLKIYLNTGGDGSAWDEVTKFVQDDKVRNKFGPMELVTDAAEANLFLVHFELKEKRREEVAHTLTMDPGTSTRIYDGGKSVNRTNTMIRGYILGRSSEGLEILRSYRFKVLVGERRRELRDALLRLLIEQTKTPK
jgi:hypothetical protein